VKSTDAELLPPPNGKPINTVFQVVKKASPLI